MKLIGVEEHFLTPDVRRAWEALPADSDCALSLRLLSPETSTRLEDSAGARIRLMDESGVDVQVLSLLSPALHDLERGSTDLARRTNDFLGAVIASHPDRFQGFATLATAAPNDAARELERAVSDIGMKGALLCGRTRERHMDHKDFWPIYETAVALGVPILIHPQVPQRSTRDVLYSGFNDETDLSFSTYGLGWHYEAGVQFVRLILAGVFDRFPRLQVILGHWGEVVLFYSERVAAMDRAAKLKRPIADYLRHNLYVTGSGMLSHDYLRRAVDIVGTDRVLFSMDHPFQYLPGRRARRFVEETALSEADREKFSHLNWERLTSGPA